MSISSLFYSQLFHTNRLYFWFMSLHFFSKRSWNVGEIHTRRPPIIFFAYTDIISEAIVVTRWSEEPISIDLISVEFKIVSYFSRSVDTKRKFSFNNKSLKKSIFVRHAEVFFEHIS